MLVVVVVVGGVAVPVVRVVDMVAVRERLMPAAGPVSVFVAGMSQVRQRVLVVMALMGGVGMAFVDVVDVALALARWRARSLGRGCAGGRCGPGARRSRFLLAVLDGVSDDVRDVLVGQGVHRLPAVPLDPDQAGPPQHPQVLGNQRLAHPEPLDQLVDEPGLVSQFHDDRQPGRGGQHLQQLPGRLERLRLRRH